MFLLVKPEASPTTGGSTQNALCGHWVVVVKVNRNPIGVRRIRIVRIGGRGNLNRQMRLELNAVDQSLNWKRWVRNTRLHREKSKWIDQVNGRIFHVEIQVGPFTQSANIPLIFGQKSPNVRIVVTRSVVVEARFRVELAARELERIR